MPTKLFIETAVWVVNNNVLYMQIFDKIMISDHELLRKFDQPAFSIAPNDILDVCSTRLMHADVGHTYDCAIDCPEYDKPTHFIHHESS